MKFGALVGLGVVDVVVDVVVDDTREEGVMSSLDFSSEF